MSMYSYKDVPLVIENWLTEAGVVCPQWNQDFHNPCPCDNCVAYRKMGTGRNVPHSP